ncbi:hypothetical protein DPMN_033926 [Dreissena polymorpha]|uniref:Uncharacterized protein n=1 Tax=Dreissena polymorpha TaxID=45954 RepID=A0A9D4RJL1_DREPO|nr:hypothetical protein DPMN_033926 [Dreissena polymorpha]
MLQTNVEKVANIEKCISKQDKLDAIEISIKDIEENCTIWITDCLALKKTTNALESIAQFLSDEYDTVKKN